MPAKVVHACVCTNTDLTVWPFQFGNTHTQKNMRTICVSEGFKMLTLSLSLCLSLTITNTVRFFISFRATVICVAIFPFFPTSLLRLFFHYLLYFSFSTNRLLLASLFSYFGLDSFRVHFHIYPLNVYDIIFGFKQRIRWITTISLDFSGQGFHGWNAEECS